MDAGSRQETVNEGGTISERDAPGTWVSAQVVFANLQLASVIRGGPVLSIDFDDGPKKTHHAVRGIRIAVPFVSNLRYHVDRYVEPAFAAVVNGEEVSFTGRSKPFSESLETTFDVNITGLDIPHYLEYVPMRREYEIPSAFLDVNAVVSFTQRKGAPPVLSTQGDLASLQVKDPEIDANMDRNGKLNLLSLVTEKQQESTVEGKGGKGQNLTVDSIRLTGGKVRFGDASTSSPSATRWTAPRPRSSPCGSRWRS